MKIGSMVSRVAVLLAAALMCTVLLTACEDEEANREYKERMTAAITEVSSATDGFTAAVTTLSEGVTEESKQGVLAAVEQLGTAYQALADLEAPKKYAEVQALYKEAPPLYEKAAKVYQEEIAALTPETFNEEFVQKLTACEEDLAGAKQKLIDAGAKGREIDGE